MSHFIPSMPNSKFSMHIIYFQWTLQQDISFRYNMSQAIIQFCNESDARLATCNLTRYVDLKVTRKIIAGMQKNTIKII